MKDKVVYIGGPQGLRSRIWTITDWRGNRLNGYAEERSRWRTKYGTHQFAFKVVLDGKHFWGRNKGPGFAITLHPTP